MERLINDAADACWPHAKLENIIYITGCFGEVDLRVEKDYGWQKEAKETQPGSKGPSSRGVSAEEDTEQTEEGARDIKQSGTEAFIDENSMFKMEGHRDKNPGDMI